MTQTPPDPLVPLKNPPLAALLAFLVPGAGHFYQGRRFKGLIYFVCILTLFFWGMQIGEGKLVYRLEPDPDYSRMLDQQRGYLDDVHFEELRDRLEQMGPSRERSKWHLGFLAQVPVGLFSIPALIQEERYYSEGNINNSPQSVTIDEPITGHLDYVTEEGRDRRIELTGRLTLAPEQGEFGREMQGEFQGTSEGTELVLSLRGLGSYDPPIGADRHRRLAIGVASMNGQELTEGELVARIDRSWVNRVLVPPEHRVLEQLHGRLGKKLTLAEVFTWVAGLLNVLAIWDAFAGPAYGYRMLPIREQDESGDAPQPTPQSAS